MKGRAPLFCLHSQRVAVARGEVEEEGVEEGQAQGRGLTMWMLSRPLDPAGREKRGSIAFRLMPSLELGFC